MGPPSSPGQPQRDSPGESCPPGPGPFDQGRAFGSWNRGVASREGNSVGLKRQRYPGPCSAGPGRERGAGLPLRVPASAGGARSSRAGWWPGWGRSRRWGGIFAPSGRCPIPAALDPIPSPDAHLKHLDFSGSEYITPGVQCIPASSLPTLPSFNRSGNATSPRSAWLAPDRSPGIGSSLAPRPNPELPAGQCQRLDGQHAGRLAAVTDCGRGPLPAPAGPIARERPAEHMLVSTPANLSSARNTERRPRGPR